MTVPAAAEKGPVAAESPVAAAADPVRWEFRLSADRRRILVLVNRTTYPESYDRWMLVLLVVGTVIAAVARPGVAASTPLSWAL